MKRACVKGVLLLVLFTLGIIGQPFTGGTQTCAEPYSLVRIDNPSPQANAWFGTAVDGLSDIDGDGIGDLAVGARGADQVYLLSGSDQSMIHTIEDPDGLSGYWFGYSVEGIGDIDGDGVEDIAVGAPRDCFGTLDMPCLDDFCPQYGRAFVFSGATGNLLLRLDPHRQFLCLGLAVSPLGDVNEDGIPDVVVGAPPLNTGGRGSVFAFSGADGSFLWRTDEPRPGPSDPFQEIASFGQYIAEVGDLTGDGYGDLLVAAPHHDYDPDPDNWLLAGRGYVLSGADGTIFRIHDNPTPVENAFFGQVPSAIGDQDGDGVEDYAFGDCGVGLVHLYSGARGTPILDIESPGDGSTDIFGFSIARVEDKDWDGLDDFWVSAPWGGVVYLMNSMGDIIEQIDDPNAVAVGEEGAFGWRLSATRDLDGDGGLDLIIGEPNESVGGFYGAGSVFLALGVVKRRVWVISPSGGETWYVGHNQNIIWASLNAGSSVKIEISRAKAFWSTIISKTSNDGAYTWNVTGPTSTACRIRITSNEYPSVSDESDANFSIRAPSLTVTSPNGGENWELWDLRDITWTSAGAGPRVTIEISRDGGSTWSTISGNTRTDGSYAWSVTGPTSNACRIRITSNAYPWVSDESDADFTIAERSRSITVIAPNGGEKWNVGKFRDITWTSTEAGSDVSIQISRDQIWSTIISKTPNDGSYTWYVTGPTSTACRIRITSNEYPSVSDESNTDLTIAEGSGCYVGIEHVQAVANLWRQAAGPPCDCDGDGVITVVDIMCWVVLLGKPCP